MVKSKVAWNSVRIAGNVGVPVYTGVKQGALATELAADGEKNFFKTLGTVSRVFHNFNGYSQRRCAESRQ